MNRSGVDPIIKAALVHCQLGTIHPFLDGSGRLGRLLITLLLMNDGVLSRPTFYPSYQLKLRRAEYCQRLTSVGEFGDYEGWVSFFCACIAETADDVAKSLGELVDLHARSEQSIRRSLSCGALNGLAFLELLEAHPIITIAHGCREAQSGMNDRLESR